MTARLPEYPVEWEWRLLSEAAHLTKRPRSLDTTRVESLLFVPMASIPDSSIELSGWESRPPAEVRSGVYFEQGNVLLAKITPCLENGKQALVPEIPGGWGYATTEVFPLSGKLVTGPFLDLYLRDPTVKSLLASKMQGTTGRQRLPKEALMDLPIPVPPLSEQRAIAAVLRTVQGAKGATEQVITATRELKRSMMRHLFTYGPEAMDHVESVELRETEYGSIPSHWDLRSLGDVIEIQRGQVDPKVEPYASMVHVGPDNIEEGTGRLQAHQTAMDLGLISGKYFFDPDWVLYSKIRPYLRKAAQPQFSGICSADMYPLRPSTPDLRQDFLFRYLLSEGFTQQATSHQSRTGIPKINRLQLGQVPIPLPDQASQAAIASNLGKLDRKIAAEEARRDALATLFDSLLHDLMTARLRVTELIPEAV